jgi:cation-transporting ATPase E
VISTFAIVNSAVSAWDEIRIKKRLDQIRISYAPKVNVIRDGELTSIPVEDLVEDDVVYLSEGEPIPTDGKLLATYSVLIDESLLTGESDYIPKSEGEHVIGGSFVVVGESVYQVSGISNGSYVNSLTQEARKFQRQKTNLQKIGDKLVIFFITASLLLGGLTFFSARSQGYSVEDSVIPLVTVVALIVPQTLIFLFTFSLSIAVVKLSAKGALVQRSAAIETLANLDVLCLDKTGTITSNQMEIVNTKYWHLDAEDLARVFNIQKSCSR